MQQIQLTSHLINHTVKAMTDIAETVHRNRTKSTETLGERKCLFLQTDRKVKQDTYCGTVSINMYIHYITYSCETVVREFGQCTENELKLIG